ncbi:hypothetical protein RRG08_021669 [Elysia crispata]|uniref:Uncharacterized protein n=1 Tax=Elysia crispata TaxID=231223 RepID=A0AAE0XN17_9GAST|nr:hypothetical protein RRG08_021669 [Elysia crispata]
MAWNGCRTQTVHVNARDNAGYTPLHESCVRGSVQVARHLIYYGADVNCCSQEGIRPIHDAIENDHIEVVRLLLVHGADPLIATYAGRTPVRIARSLSMLQTLQGYIGDLNGWSDGEEEDDDEDEERVEEIPWRFTSSLTFYESSQEEKCSPCVDLPCAPPDDSGDVFDDGPTSAINVFHLALEGEDRTPQPFSLLDEVLNRLAIPRDKLSALYEWKLSSVTLSSERVREVASCCCSNVSIRLPQSGEVTLLPLATLREIEAALRKQGSSAWLVGSAGPGRPGSAPSGGTVKVKKEPLDSFGSSGSSSSPSASQASFSSSSSAAAGKGNPSGMGYRHYNFSSISGGSLHSHNNNNNSSSSSSSSTTMMPTTSPLGHSDKPESVRRSDALSRVPILTKMEQQAGGFSASGAGQQLFSSDGFRAKQVLQPARDLFHPVSSTPTTPTSAAFKGKTSPSAFSLASAASSLTTTTSALGGAISSSIPSSTSFFSKHTKLKTTSSFPFSSSTSSFSSSLGLNQQKGSYQGSSSALHSSWSPQPPSSSSSSFTSSSAEQRQQPHHGHQGLKKSGAADHQRSSHHHQQQQTHHHVKQQQQRSTPTSHGSSSSYGKSTQSTSSKEGRSSTGSGSSAQRKVKKDDPEGSWLNTPMFSDDSSSSPFHTSIDFDSENSD